jgi:DNA-directed RNA polymerase subunit M/transcription elongation factor TFIIS
MTLSCASCGRTDVQLVDDNGAEYPETRVEFYECQHCNNEFRKVLSA